MAFQPTSSTNRPVNPVVVDLTYGLGNPEDRYITERAFPAIDVGKDFTGTIMGFGSGTFFGDPKARYERAPGSIAHEATGPTLANVTYACQQYSEFCKIPREVLERTELAGGDPAKLQAGYMSQVFNDLRIAQDYRLSTALAAWSVSATPANKWDVAAGNPIADIQTAVETVAGYGPDPDIMVIGRQARRTLQTSPAILDFLKTTEDRNFLNVPALSGLLSSWFGIPSERIFYANARYATSAQGQALTLGDVFGDWVWVGKTGRMGFNIAGGVNIEPCALARMVHKPFEWVEWDENNDNTLRVRGFHEEVLKTIQSELGYLIDNVTT